MQIVCLIATFSPKSEYIVACCCQSCPRCCQLLNSLKLCCTYRMVLGCSVALSLTNQTASTKVLLFADCILFSFLGSAFSALTLWVGRQEERPVCKHCMMRCWCGYLSGARCRLFAYGPADATAIPKPRHLLPHLNPDWFYFSGTVLPRLS